MTNVHEKSHNTGKDNLILLQISKKPQLKYNTKNKKNIHYLNYTYQEEKI